MSSTSKGWLPGGLQECSFKYRLVTSAKEFQKLLSKLRLGADAYCDDGALAQTYHYRDAGVCLVCLKEGLALSDIEVFGLLVHEAVHVWQFHCEWIGEEKPGNETEAYAIQKIATELIKAYSKSSEIKNDNAQLPTA